MYSSDEVVMMQQAEMLEQLEQHPGFKILMRDIEVEAENALHNLRNTDSSDPLVIHDLVRKWRERDLLIEQIRNIIQSAKLARLALTEDRDD